MLDNDRSRIIGEVIFCGLLAEPFFHSATDFLMHREYPKAIVGYLIGAVPAIIGLIILGVLRFGPFTQPVVSHWLRPIIANPRWWLALWFIFLAWLLGPKWALRTLGREVRLWPVGLTLTALVACGIFLGRRGDSDARIFDDANSGDAIACLQGDTSGPCLDVTASLATRQLLTYGPNSPKIVIKTFASDSAQSSDTASLSVQAPPSPAPDLRQIPLHEKGFFDSLPINHRETVIMVCFPFDPMSCNIAAQYRDHFATHWNVGGYVFDYRNPAPFKGISIITKSEDRSAVPDAGSLRDKLGKYFPNVGFPIADPHSLPLKANEFAVWIGGPP